jgi:hypothetical protein
MKRSVDDRCELKAKEKGIEMRSPCSRAAAEMFRDRLDRYALKRASLLHLIDLKRGGHSPAVQNYKSSASPIAQLRSKSIDLTDWRPKFRVLSLFLIRLNLRL